MSEAKKIAIVFSGDFPEGNTKNARLKLVAKELKVNGLDASFFSAFPYRFSKTLYTKQPKKWEDFPIHFFSIGRKYPLFFPFRILQILFSHVAIQLWTVTFAAKYDVFYYYNPRLTDTLPSLLINRLLGRKCMVDQTELFSSGKNSSWHNLEESLIAKYASILLVISERLHLHYYAIRKGELHRFPIVVDFDRFESDKKEQKYLMGYIGSFASKDGIGLLLQATKELAKKNPDIMLRLIGHNPRMNELEKEVKDLGIAKNVEITGTVAYKEVPWLLNECDTLLMNRDNSRFSTYGYPIKLGEYFACNKPVVMSDGGGFSNDYEHRNQVYKYKVNDVESLVEAILVRYGNIGEADAVCYNDLKFLLPKTCQFQ